MGRPINLIKEIKNIRRVYIVPILFIRLTKDGVNRDRVFTTTLKGLTVPLITFTGTIVKESFLD